ncbi:MAG: AbrB/MazE/SpoVT family DNA-binding domain-containing protein [Lachnospiraceae bacterium]|nr:AbrB/MazE/SpoVT family DNA-binding domain-containing protein [Lachnospiraceae bacterium]
MRETGVIRRIDNLGRIVIPKEIRTKWGIKNGDSFDIYIHRDEIVLKKTNSSPGLNELIIRLEEKFHNVKDEMDIDISNSIYEHINALREILNKINEKC